MAFPNNFDFPHFPPPPPPIKPPPPPPPHVHPPPPPPPPSPPHVLPPPPHVRPPPAPLPPSPPPSNNTTIIVVVFVSFGGVLLFALLAVALCCFIKKRKKRTEETDIIHVDEHKKVKEVITTGPHGEQAMILQIDDDVHVDEKIMKKEKVGHEGLHANNKEGSAGSRKIGLEIAEEASSSSGSDRARIEHKP